MINTAYYTNLQTRIVDLPIPNVISLNLLTQAELQVESDKYDAELTKLGNVCNQALTGVTDLSCAQLALLGPLIVAPTSPQVLQYLADVAAIYAKTHTDILATVTAMIPVSEVVSESYTTKLEAIQLAFSSVATPVAPIPSGPTVDPVQAC